MTSGIYSRKNKKIKGNCSFCKKIILIHKHHLKANKNNFCSLKCKFNWSKGKKIDSGKKGMEHFNWKGNKVGYMGVHNWIRKNKPKPKVCEDCQKKIKLELANLSGKYKRDIADYKYLCRSCHFNFDGTNKKIVFDEIVNIKRKKCDEIFWDIETETENFIAEDIITHNSKPHKKSIACNTFLPNILREKVEVVIAIDTSGSIGKKELTDFISEIVGMLLLNQLFH